MTKPHKPTEEARKTVETMAAVGIPEDRIAVCVGISAPTLRKYYRTELDTAMDRANAKVAGTLFNNAISGDTTACIFWCKTRLKWKETTTVDVNNNYVAVMPEKAETTEEWKQRYAPTLQ